MSAKIYYMDGCSSRNSARRVNQTATTPKLENLEITPADLDSFMCYRAICKVFYNEPVQALIGMATIGSIFLVIGFLG